MFLVPESDDPQALEVKRLGIRPGDRLVIKLDHFPTDEEIDGIQAAMHRAFESADYRPPLLVLDPGMEIGIIGPEDDKAAKPTRLTLEFDGSPDDEFIRWMRKYIRTSGGGPAQTALGS